MEAATLAQYGQEHLLDGLDELPADARERFLARLAEVDWEELAHPAEPPPLGDVEPPEVVTLAEQEVRRAELREAGEDAYRDGRVAVLMVAGGQGTRLGWPGPKGTFPIGPHSGRTIYALQAEKVLALSRRVGRDVPLLVLTSPATDDETREHFRTHGDFGLAPGQVRPFVQGTVPSVDRDGRALLAEPGLLLENPDGHGGVFEALVRSGELERLRHEHVEHLVYIQVDNVLAPVDDPRLVGLAALEGTDVVTKVLEKAHPDEKVGHLVRAGRPRPDRRVHGADARGHARDDGRRRARLPLGLAGAPRLERRLPRPARRPRLQAAAAPEREAAARVDRRRGARRRRLEARALRLRPASPRRRRASGSRSTGRRSSRR